MVVDRILEQQAAASWREKFGGALAQVRSGDRSISLFKPLSYMNRSGDCVQPVVSFYKLSMDELLVIHDELDLPFGTLRLKRGGGNAGHNGLRSITARLGSSDYTRLRIGIGRPPPDFPGTGADYVLQGFAAAERQKLPDLISRAALVVSLVVDQGLESAMNQVNQRSIKQDP